MAKINYQNLPSTSTPLNATNMNSMQEISNYSLNEKEVGNWVNGKPIYRKVIDFGSLPNATTKEVDHNISNLDYIVQINAIAITSTKYFLYIPYFDITDGITLFGSSTKVGIRTMSDRSSYSTYIVIDYTKTTD